MADTTKHASAVPWVVSVARNVLGTSRRRNRVSPQPAQAWRPRASSPHGRFRCSHVDPRRRGCGCDRSRSRRGGAPASARIACWGEPSRPEGQSPGGAAIGGSDPNNGGRPFLLRELNHPLKHGVLAVDGAVPEPGRVSCDQAESGFSGQARRPAVPAHVIRREAAHRHCPCR
jgi:hypothetical protein